MHSLTNIKKHQLLAFFYSNDAAILNRRKYSYRNNHLGRIESFAARVLLV
jgi:hypothetical protein